MVSYQATASSLLHYVMRIAGLVQTTETADMQQQSCTPTMYISQSCLSEDNSANALGVL